MVKFIARAALVLGASAMLAAPAGADERSNRIKAAMEAAITFLKQKYKQVDGFGPSGGWEEGPTALAGIALLEAGVKADDPVIQDIAKIVRTAAIKQRQTYVLSLDIIFLDKLGEPIDTTLIQSMAIRLLKGQNRQGGWSYQSQVLPPEEQTRLANALGSATLKGGKELPQVGASVDSRPKLEAGNEHLLKTLPQLPEIGMDDNSNTQFATIGLFASRRHGVPVEQSLSAVENRFRRLQGQDGGWSYTSGGVRISSAPMTCAGLIGLAVGTGMRREARLRSKGVLGPDGKLTIEGSKEGAKRDKSPLEDPAVQRGLNFVVQCMKFSGRGAKEPAGPGPTPPGPEGAYGAELRNNFYFLWSLERVCAVFGLNDINGFDWHGWVVDFVLKWQAPDGSWSGTKIGFHGSPSNDIVDTSFALMFLMKANIVKDLTKLLKSGDLPSKPSEARPGATVGNAKPPVKPPADTNVAKEADSAALTDALVKAGPSEQELLIERYEKEKGGIYSQALADAIPKLSGETQLKARDALASRMSRMSARTLKAWLKDADSPELRRAAAIAMSMGDDVSELKSFVPDLIEALNDADEIVWRGAAVGLREIAKKVPGGADGANLGPRKDDSEAKRRKAIADWKAWYEKHKG